MGRTVGQEHAAQVLAGRETYEVTQGSSHCMTGRICSSCRPRSGRCEGVFLAFQYPVEIPGVSTSYFLKAAVNAVRKYHGEPEIDTRGVSQSGQGEDGAAEDGSELHESRGKRGIFRR